MKNTVDTISIDIAELDVISSDAVQNLGLFFDGEFRVKSQITKTIKSCNFHPINISRIRPFLNTNTINSFYFKSHGLLKRPPWSSVQKMKLTDAKSPEQGTRLSTLSKKKGKTSFPSSLSSTLPGKVEIDLKICLYNVECINN